jgi:hypothetical protein
LIAGTCKFVAIESIAHQKMMRVTVADDSIYDIVGERVMVAGIKLARYALNPVLLFQHLSQKVPVGRLENMRVEGSKLVGDCVFHLEDDASKLCAKLYERGFMRGFSIAYPHAGAVFSDLPEHKLQGQKGHTVLECELAEVSAVTIPANMLAVSDLSSIEQKALNENSLIRKSAEQGFIFNQFLKQSMELVKKALSLGESDGEAQVVAAINALHKKAADMEAAFNRLNNERQTEKVGALIEKAVQERKITPSEADFYKKFASSDFEGCKSLLAMKKAPEQLAGAGAGTGAAKGKTLAQKIDERDEWSLTDWHKKDAEGLFAMRAQFPEQYQKLVGSI